MTNAPEANGASEQGSGASAKGQRGPHIPSSPRDQGQPRTGVPSTAETPPESPTTPLFVKADEIKTGPPGADGGLETVNPSVPVEGSRTVQVIGTAGAARERRGCMGGTGQGRRVPGNAG